MFDIQRYTPECKAEWNAFLTRSKNGTFLFDRGYMDYHSDRFEDCSLMIYDKRGLYAMLPANRCDDVLYSHQGLTYGGLVMNERCTTAAVRDLFSMLNIWLRDQGFSRVVYKPVPWIYTSLPSGEDLYALSNVCHAQLTSRDVASVVILDRRLPFSTLRRRGIKKAEKAQVTICESDDWTAFWSLLEERLLHRHGAYPVHTLSEIQMLHEHFPDIIRLFAAYKDGHMIGGTVLYVTRQTVKTQYIAANDEGLAVGALDMLFNTLLTQGDGELYSFTSPTTHHIFFDFGTSNMPGSDDLHDSLIFQKEGFGARAVCYDTYEWNII